LSAGEAMAPSSRPAATIARIIPRHSLAVSRSAISFARQRNQLAAIFDGVDQRIEATNEEMADAQIVIVAKDLATCSGVPTSAVVLLLAPVSLAISVQRRFVDAGACSASASSRRAPAVA